MHWTDAFAPSGRVNGLVAPNVDPRSGQPEFKHTPARARPYRETWRGFFLTRHIVPPPELDLIWRRIPRTACQLYEFAGRGDASERDALRRALVKDAPGEMLRFEDQSAGSLREAYVGGERLERLLFTTVAGVLPPRDWLAALFEADLLEPLQRAALLVGRAPGAAVALAPLICTCLNVRADAIAAAIEGGAPSVDAIGEATGAGTSCGSCRPELRRLLASRPAQEVRHAA
jgi:assimilatory nitrate reductase catalytic subunit